MKSYPVGTTVSVTIPLIDINGDPVTPTAVRAIVTDETDQMIDSLGFLPYTEGETDVTVIVVGARNTVPGLRNITLTVTTPFGSYDLPPSRFIIAPSVPLVILKNSFQTYSQAVLEASQMVPNLAWENASELDRINALATAFDQLTKFGYRIRRTVDIDDQSHLGDYEYRVAPYFWPVMPMETWLGYPEGFRKALRRAQIAQAAELVDGDKVLRKRRQGLLSETIGESSMMFRSGKPMDIGVSKEVQGYLQGYLDFRVTLTRS